LADSSISNLFYFAETLRLYRDTGVAVKMFSDPKAYFPFAA
jgi:hypothetical protein